MDKHYNIKDERKKANVFGKKRRKKRKPSQAVQDEEL